MTNIYKKFDVIVAKFYFASSKAYKVRPAIIISSDFYHENSRGNLIAIAVSSQVENKLSFEFEIEEWKEAGLLKPSILKSNIATIEKSEVIKKLGSLHEKDRENLDSLVQKILKGK
jgi:mRNA interferase MazF